VIKKKIKNEDPTINFKLPLELKMQVTKEAQKLNCTVSNYIRNHLIEFLSGKLFEKEIAIYESLEFVNSTEFLQLIAWVLIKKKDEKCNSTEVQLNGYKRSIKKLEGNLPNDIIVEFDKVLGDLIRVQGDKGFIRSFRVFGNGYTKPLFDYDKLEEFLLNEVKSFYSITINPQI
jgi:hypothetical protein